MFPDHRILPSPSWVSQYRVARASSQTLAQADPGSVAAPVEASAKIFAATPGFRRLLTRSWEILLRSPNPMRMTLGFNALSTVLFSNTTVATTQHLEEVIEGAGYIDLIPPDEDRNPLLRQDTRFLGHVFDFVDDVDRLLMRGNAYPEPLGPLTEELLAIGIIPSITKVTKILTGPSAEEPKFSPLIEKSLIFLNRVLPTDLGFSLLADALERGLIYVVARCVAVSKFPKPLIFMLNDILRKCLINYYNLLILRDELPAVRDPKPAARPRYLPPGNISTFRLSDNHDLDSRERRFLRALLTHEYNAYQYTDIYPAQFTFMAHNPHQLSLTLFDYRAGRVRIEVKPIHDSGLEQRFGASGVDGYRNDIVRAACSRRMDLHVVAIPGPVGSKDEAVPRYFGVPFRSEGHRDDFLQRIAERYDAARITEPEPRPQDVFADMRMPEGARGSAFH
ncbi:hypothetical protein B0H11DRAFT_2225010 [Mycena galericulata]|nr:hypothetical protein B0H11DRAFT_2225010 [Mycena galericulata]